MDILKKAVMPHSHNQFGRQRDFWWNPDFIALLAERVGLGTVRDVADVGSGIGHWSSVFLPFCDMVENLVCIDKEPEWVSRVEKEIRKRISPNKPLQIRALCSGAENIDLPSNSFDLVTCQTLLMHLERPKDALLEMLRIARPGGKVLCVEPNNLLNYIEIDSTAWDLSVGEHALLYQFWMFCNRGRISLGRGNDAIGQLLPGLMQSVGLKDIRVYLSDMASSFLPPYSSEYQLEYLQDLRAKDAFLDPGDIELAIAGGASEELIEGAKRAAERQHHLISNALQESRFHSAGGSLLYIVWGRKEEKERD